MYCQVNYLMLLCIYDSFLQYMDHYPPLPAKRARARRMLIRKQKYIKRLKTTAHQPKVLNSNNGVGTFKSPCSTSNPIYATPTPSSRNPLADITTFVNNQKSVEQVVAEGQALRAMFGGPLPRPSYHGFRNHKRCLNIQDVGTNLMNRFTAHDKDDVTGSVSQCKRGRGRPKKLQIDANTTRYAQGHIETGSSTNHNRFDFVAFISFSIFLLIFDDLHNTTIYWNFYV